VDCQRCDGPAAGNLLLSPLALASGRDGALYVGDYNYIRRLSPGRDDVATILQLRYAVVSYRIIDLKLQNRLKVATDKPKLKVKMQSVSDDDLWEDFLKSCHHC